MDEASENEVGLGPFNGQAGRVAIVQEVLKKLEIATFVETGTFLGETSLLVASWGPKVFTVELDPHRQPLLEKKFAASQNIDLTMGDSRAFLRRLIARPICPLQKVMFYLDAHWNRDLPLREEVEFIIANWRHSVIVIDDFRVPDDSGYEYDSYPGVGELTQDYLSPLPLTYFWPAVSSREETGARRGCTVLAWDEETRQQLESLETLRT